jgi:hypothetical protein
MPQSVTSLSSDFIPKNDARSGHSLTAERSAATAVVCSCARREMGRDPPPVCRLLHGL